MSQYLDVITTRPLNAADLQTLFEFQADAASAQMAAFTSKNVNDRDAYMTKWQRLLNDPTIVARAIMWTQESSQAVIVGSVGSFLVGEERNVTYGIGRQYWGRGFATRGLQLLVMEMTDRPLFARAASDNTRSIRVLEKCGFREIGREHFFAEARSQEIEETLFKLP